MRHLVVAVRMLRVRKHFAHLSHCHSGGLRHADFDFNDVLGDAVFSGMSPQKRLRQSVMLDVGIHDIECHQVKLGGLNTRQCAPIS